MAVRWFASESSAGGIRYTSKSPFNHGDFIYDLIHIEINENDENPKFVLEEFVKFPGPVHKERLKALFFNGSLISVSGLYRLKKLPSESFSFRDIFDIYLQEYADEKAKEQDIQFDCPAHDILRLEILRAGSHLRNELPPGYIRAVRDILEQRA